MNAGKKTPKSKPRKKNLRGHPPIIKTPAEFDAKVDKYFGTGCMKPAVDKYGGEITIRRPTITGLCLYLGFCDKQSFYDNEKREGFSYSVKRARAMIEMVYEERLAGNANAGSIFALKQFGWRDKQEIEISSSQATLDALAKGRELAK